MRPRNDKSTAECDGCGLPFTTGGGYVEVRHTGGPALVFHPTCFDANVRVVPPVWLAAPDREPEK